MQRLHTVITGVLTALLLTSAGVGAVSTGQVGDAIGGVAGVAHDGTATPTNGTAPTNTTTPTASATPANGSAPPSTAPDETDEPELRAFLDRFDLTDDETDRIVSNVAELRASGTSRARVFHAVGHGLHDVGTSVEEFRGEAWRLRLRLFLTRFDLTVDERDAVVEAVEAERAANEDWSEIRSVVVAELGALDVSRAELRRAWRHSRHEFLHLRIHVLEHRQDRLRAIDERFHDDGEHPDGLPAWAHRVQHNHDLTDEEIHAVLDRVERLQRDGASRAEIERAVRGMLEEFEADG